MLLAYAFWVACIMVFGAALSPAGGAGYIGAIILSLFAVRWFVNWRASR